MVAHTEGYLKRELSRSGRAHENSIALEFKESSLSNCSIWRVLREFQLFSTFSGSEREWSHSHK
eukprot:1370800-Amorphochlora_amoeboformis.AAC.1